MPTVADIRKQYPQYNDLSDDELVNGLRRKFYSDLPEEEFYKRIQYTPEAGVFTELGRGLVRSAGNVVGGFATPIEDAFGKNSASDWLRETGKDITGSVTARTTPGLYEAYDEGGVLGALKSLAINVSESAVPTLGGILVGVLTKNPAAARSVMGLTIAPTAYTSIREDQEQTGFDNKAAAAVGAVASTALDVLTGGGAAVANIGRKAILDMFEAGMRKAAKEVAKTGRDEAGTEIIQNVIEQVAAGADPTTKDRVMQTLEAGATGLVGGTFFGGASEGVNSLIASRYRKAAAQVPPLHSVDILREGEENPDTIDIISAPTEDGMVIARGPNGAVFNTTLDALEEVRLDKGAEGVTPLRDAVLAAVAEREAASPKAQSALDEAVSQIITTPEDQQAFNEIVKQFTTLYGIPEEQAKQLALGAIQPQAAPAAETAPPVAPVTEPIPEPTAAGSPVAPPVVEPAAPVAPAPAVEPMASPASAATASPTPTPTAITGPTLYHGGRRGMTPDDISIIREPGATKQGKKGKVYGGFYTTTNPEEASAYAAMAQGDNTVYQVQLKPDAVIEQKEGDITRLTPQQINDYVSRGVDVVVGKDVRGRIEHVIVNRDAVVGMQDLNAPVAPTSTPAPAATPAPAPAPTELAAPEVIEGALPEPVAPEAAEVTLPEAPTVEAAPVEEPTVPVTKLPPGVARGVKPVQRGTQGTERGRPVEGAAQLTQGMRAQQALIAELQAARDAREISDAELAEVTNMLRPPTSEQALRALPTEQRNQWIGAIQAQREVDEMQTRVSQVPKLVLGQPNPERIDLEQTLGKLQQRLDTAQQDIVRGARDRFEGARKERVTKTKALRRLLREGRLSEANRREALIALRENTVQRAQQGESVTDDPRSPEEVEEELRGKSANEVVQWLVETAPNQAMRVIARGVQRALGRLQAMGVGLEYYNVDVDQHPEMPEGTRKSLDTDANAITRFDYPTSTITVWVNGADQGPFSGMSYGTLLHEFVHAATSPLLEYGLQRPNSDVGRLTRDLKDVLAAIRSHARQNQNAEVGLPSGNILDDEHELLAWTLSDTAAMKYLDTVPYRGKQSIFQRLVEVIRNILGLSASYDTALGEVLRIGDALFSVGESRTAQAVEGVVSRPAVVSRAAKKAKKASPAEKIDKGLFKAQMANSAAGFTEGLDEAAEGAKLENKVKRQAAIDALTSTASPALAEFQPTSWIKDSIKKVRPALGSILEGIDKLDQNMRGMRSSMQKAMRRRVKEVERFTNKYGQDALSQMMTIARVNRFNPAAYKTRAEALQKDAVLQHYIQKGSKSGVDTRTKEINTAFDAWERLGKQEGGHETYLRMRQFYKDMYTALRAAQDQEIRNLGLDKEATNNLIRAARGDLDEDAVVEDGDIHAGVPEKLFPEEYFPFRRFGEYVLIVKGSKRNLRERYHFESAKERNLFQEKRAKQLGLTRGTDAYNARFEQLDGLQSQRDNMSNESFLLKRLFEAVDNAKEPAEGGGTGTGKFKDNLKDRIYQTYLMTLPERNLRKQFLHAELVTGQSADALRVFKVAASQYASQLPKVLYGSQIQTQIEAAFDTAKEGDPAERARLRSLLNAYASRVRDTMSPAQQGKWEQRINEFTFLSLMTSVASAIVQPLTLPFQVMPRLISRYGFDGAFKTVSMYTPLFNVTKITTEEDPATGERWFTAPSIGNTDFIRNNPLRARLWKELDVKRDLFSQKHADMILRNRPSRSTVGNTKRAQALSAYEDMVNVSGALFSSADQLAREMAGMSYAELEYAKLRKEGKDHEAAIAGAVDAAVQNTNETIGNYTELEKPGIFRGNALKRMIGFLRTYSVQRTAYYFRMLDAVFKGAPTQTRLQAFNELSMVLAFTAMGAGISANFGYSFICNVIDTLLALMLSDEDKEEWRRQDPLGADDADYRFRFEWIPKHFGSNSTATRIMQRGALSELTGWDFSTRLSQNELWFRSFPKGDTAKENVLNFLTTNLAPQVSQSATMLDGVDLFMQGEWSKGFAKLLPAAIRGAVNAERFATEGETTQSGQVVMGSKEFTDMALVGQVLGFTPTELAKVREINRTTESYRRAMLKERDRLFKDYRDVMANDDSTPEDINVVLDKMRAFNRKIPLGSDGRPLSKFRIDREDILRSLRSTAVRTSKSYRGVEYSPGEGAEYFPYEQRKPVAQ